jgi:GntP family gluconate:H+ symporter
LAVSCIGYVFSSPVFCDAAFVILAQLNKSLAQKTKTSLVGLSVALSTGLFAPHVLIPPTPGPLAAAANLNLTQLSSLILTGGIIGFILILVGGGFALYVSKKYPYVEKEISVATNEENDTTPSPAFSKALLPILLPLLLMCLGAFLPKNIMSESIGPYVQFISRPSGALGMGVLFALALVLPKGKKDVSKALHKGLRQALPILLITAMGGALGKMIGHISLETQLANISHLASLGLLVPFLIAALLKTAQGSSTVAIITAASIVFPLLPLLGLTSEMGKVWVIMAIGTGAMTVSHANDSYFWIVSQMSNMDVKTAYKTHTLGTLIQGTVGIVVVLLGYYGWLWLA